MSNPELDFEAIREKLQRQNSSHPTRTAATSVDWEAPLNSNSTGRSQTQLNGTVAALQQRSAARQVGGTVLEHQTGFEDQARQQLLRQLSLHRERLQQKAQEINGFSMQQERAMLEMKDVVERWRREVNTAAASADIDPTTADSLIREFLCEYESAVLAWADTETEGVILSYRSADLYQATREANQIAQTLRRHQASSFDAGGDRWSEWQTLWAEPADGLRGVWSWLEDSARRWWKAATNTRASQSSARKSSQRFTLIDAVIWLGSGIFSRVVLDFVLTLYPGLWSVAVAIVTGMTAYALYRATLAPRLDFGLAYRVLLAIGGLIVGGRL